MDVLSVLQFFGFTPANVTPLVVLGGIGIFFVYQHTRPVRSTLEEIRIKFAVVESRVSDLWKDKIAPASSPRQLNDRGEDILTVSGIQTVIDSKKDELLAAVREKNPATAYDAENCIINIAMELPKRYPELLPQLKEGAFKAGATLDATLFVGGVYLRNAIFSSLGFDVKDIQPA